MSVEYFRLFHAYNCWANHRLWDESILSLSEEQFTQHQDFSRGSIREQVRHIITVEYWWPTHIWKGPEATQALFARFEQGMPESRADIRALWDEAEANLGAYLDVVTDAELLRPFDHTAPDGRAVVHTPTQILTQVFTHSLDHRAQVMAVLHQMGAPTFTQDFLAYLWAEGAK